MVAYKQIVALAHGLVNRIVGHGQAGHHAPHRLCRIADKQAHVIPLFGQLGGGERFEKGNDVVNRTHGRIHFVQIEEGRR